MPIEGNVTSQRGRGEFVQGSGEMSDEAFTEFGGSGATLIAAEKTGRKARLTELDPKYADIIIRRWQGFTGRKAIHHGSGMAYDDIAD